METTLKFDGCLSNNALNLGTLVSLDSNHSLQVISSYLAVRSRQKEFILPQSNPVRSQMWGIRLFSGVSSVCICKND